MALNTLFIFGLLALCSCLVCRAEESKVCDSPNSSLKAARELQLPTDAETLRREPKVYRFWERNEKLLEEAWAEWNEREAASLPVLNSSLLNADLVAAVEAAWANPSVETEAAVKRLWTEVAPGVFAIQFLDLEQVDKLRAWFDATAEAGIPTRPPYGIVLNRKGVMIDQRSIGYLAAPHFQTFYQMLVHEYVRPLGRMFFPESIVDVDDDQTFSFSIQYQGKQGGDKSLRSHSDASTVTFNLNFDASKTWTGSSLVFFTPLGKQNIEWMPGYAFIHLGATMHAALPIESGTRSNWVIWTMPSEGAQEYGAAPQKKGDGSYPAEDRLSVTQRWTKIEQSDSKAKSGNRWSPF